MNLTERQIDKQTVPIVMCLWDDTISDMCGMAFVSSWNWSLYGHVPRVHFKDYADKCHACSVNDCTVRAKKPTEFYSISIS